MRTIVTKNDLPQIPHSVDAEQGALSSMIQTPALIPSCAAKILPKHFFVPANREVYSALIELYGTNIPVDLISLTQHLRDKKNLDSVGGAFFVTQLSTFVPSSVNIEYYLEILQDKYNLREIIRGCEEGARQAYEEETVEKILADTQKILQGILVPQKQEKTIQEITMETLELLDSAKAGRLPGLSTGLIDLDRKIGGMKPGQLIIIAGETSQGKSSLALKIVIQNAITEKIPTVLNSLEMSGTEIVERIMGALGRVDMHRFKLGRGPDGDHVKITNIVPQINESKLMIRDQDNLRKIIALARTSVQNDKIQLFVVDYLQLITGFDENNREKEMSGAAQALKNLAQELGITVVAMSQVNDEGRIRESRAIGHHADIVIMLKRDEGDTGLHVVKNRSGPTGSVRATFLRNLATFENAARRENND